MEKNDTRHLKRSASGHYRSGGGQIICDICAFKPDCAITPLHECSFFLPSLGFNDRTGMEVLFNTIRVGKAWPERIQVGQTIGLWCPDEKAVFGHANVVNMFTGPIAEILKKHAGANHLYLGTASFPQAARQLYAWLRQQYGPRIINGDTTLTAIYLLRERKAPKAPSNARPA